MKILLRITLFMLIFGLSVMGNTKVYAMSAADLLNEVAVENIGDIAEGKVIVKGTSSIEKVKIKITHNQIIKYHDVYIVNGNFEETLWLLDGIGTYEIKVLINSNENSYICDSTFMVHNTLEANEIDSKGMYLNPEKDIASDNEQISLLAETITTNCITDIEKAQALYSWVSSNIHYDYDKFSSHNNQIYNFEYGSLVALEYGKGVCYDMAALYAALARSLNLETKLIKGQGITPLFNGYHAWNEIYSKEEQRWIKLDVSFASTSTNNFFDTSNFDYSHIKSEEM